MAEEEIRFFDHTGDFGAELTADSRDALFARLGRAFLLLLLDDPDAVSANEARTIEVEGVDDADLLVSLGNELLYLFEAEGWLAARLAIVEAEETKIRADTWGEPFDPQRHPIARPIKAVTHHGVHVERDDEGRWRARLVFDL